MKRQQKEHLVKTILVISHITCCFFNLMFIVNHMNEVTSHIFKHQRICEAYVLFFCVLLNYILCQKLCYKRDNLSKAQSETFPCVCPGPTYHLLDNHKLNNSNFLHSLLDFGNLVFHPIFVLCPPYSWIKSFLNDLCALKTLTSTEAWVPTEKSWKLAVYMSQYHAW